MDHVDSGTLREKYSYEQMTEKESFVEMGQILRTMHIPEAEGYGHVINGAPEYKNFQEWLTHGINAKKIKHVQENGLLGIEHGSLPVALEALMAHAGKSTKSSYCHNDYAAYNIFNTNPLTIFDPDPSLNDGYIDLGRSIVIAIAHGKLPETREQLIKGYFGNTTFDKKALQASVLLNSYAKISHWHKKKRVKNIQNTQEHLIQTRHLLQ